MYKKIISVMSVALVVFLCFQSPVYADQVSVYQIGSSQQNFNDNTVWVNNNTTIFRPCVIQYDADYFYNTTYYGNSTQPYPANPFHELTSGESFLYEVVVSQTVRFRNGGDYYVYANNDYIAIKPNLSFNVNYLCFYIEDVPDDFVFYTYYNGEFRFKCTNSDYDYMGRFGIPKDGSNALSFKIHFIYDYAKGYRNGILNWSMGTPLSDSTSYIQYVDCTMTNPTTFSNSNVDSSANGVIRDWQLKYWIKEIFNKIANSNQAYNDNQQNIQDTNDQASDVTDTVDTQHQAESNYFQDNQTAINDTGIGTFQFDSDTTSGLNGIKDDFTAVWTACGGLSKYWIASLTIGLALSIIRHRRMFEK